ncbi:MAG: NUDIX hydrolase [Myxococcaceae bacterium]|nr:NUDIX hydrolase [Myxococcaceae bacterium]MCI0670254.1 NUDIX hydrolase [Myxococcaceae bacterium]
MARPSLLMSLPKHLSGIMHEVMRHLLRRPVVGIAAVARTPDGRVLLVRRGDTGEWALPGGTLEWGELLSDCIVRELQEEAGVHALKVGPVTGVYSRPDRDWRFHAVTVFVLAEVTDEVHGPKNLLEIREARLFRPEELPAELGMGHTEPLRDALTGRPAVLE